MDLKFPIVVLHQPQQQQQAPQQSTLVILQQQAPQQSTQVVLQHPLRQQELQNTVVRNIVYHLKKNHICITIISFIS